MKAFVIIIIFQFLGFNTQTVYNVEQDGASMTVTGTSSLHNWESTIENFKYTASITVEENTLLKINQLEFTASVKSIKSGKGGMDKKTYKALRETDYPTISYNLISAIPQSGNTVTSTGELIIAGKKRKVSMDVNYEIYSNIIVFRGELTIKMSDYEISPPTALMGTIKTGDEVTIRFSIPFQK